MGKNNKRIFVEEETKECFCKIANIFSAAITFSLIVLILSAIFGEVSLVAVLVMPLLAVAFIVFIAIISAISVVAESMLEKIMMHIQRRR